MAVREFSGSDRISTAAGGVSAAPNGDYSMVAVCKPNGLSTGAVMGLAVGDTQLRGSIIVNSVNLRVFTDAIDSGAFVGTTDAEWQIFAMTKGAGTVNPRFHRKKLGAGSWSHSNGGATLPDDATTITRVTFGASPSFGSLGLFKPMRLATAAVFGTALSDADVESIEASGTQGLVDLAALAAWDFNQASIATAVDDLVGAADQSVISGTTVITGDDPPDWPFGASGGGTGGVGGTGPDTYLHWGGAWVAVDRQTRTGGVWV